MGGFKRHASPTGVEPTAKVDFAGVTGISRPVSNEEHWALYYFEAHAVQCDACVYPLTVSKEGRQLCDEGHGLAIEVAKYLIYLHKDGEVYSREREAEKEVRVEVPRDYKQTISLLKAINRATRKGEKFLSKPRSLDRHYLVEPRISAEKSKRKDEVSPPSMRQHYDTVVREPKTPKKHRERESINDLVADSKRGSLYDRDMGELEKAERRDEKLRYNVEIREPSFKSARRQQTIYS